MRIITPPAVMPVSLAEAKAQCAIADTDVTHDALLTRLIAAGTARAEDMTGRRLVDTVCELRREGVPAGRAPLVLPHPPLLAVSELAFTPEWGAAEIVLDPAEYKVETDADYGRLFGRVVPREDWPTACDVRVQLRCGYGVNNGVPTTPEPIRQWILVFISTAFEHPEAFLAGRVVVETPKSFVDGLLSPYIVHPRVG